MNIWHHMNSDRVSPNEFIAVVEIEKGSKKKYELDKETGLIILDRVLHTATHYPANYGFIPKTYAEDNDPLDVLIFCSESLAPLTLVQCRPIGVITMIDSGNLDHKILAVPINDPVYNNFHDIDDLPSHIFNEITHFFRVYKELEHKETVVNETEGKEAALKIIAESIVMYKEKFEKNLK